MNFVVKYPHRVLGHHSVKTLQFLNYNSATGTAAPDQEQMSNSSYPDDVSLLGEK